MTAIQTVKTEPLVIHLGKLLPSWQDSIKTIATTYDDRSVHVIYDNLDPGQRDQLIQDMVASGKTMHLLHSSNSKSLSNEVWHAADEVTSFIFTFPSELTNKQLTELFMGIEAIKNGEVFNFRVRKNQWRTFDEPQIFIFTKRLFSEDYLTRDKWKYHMIDQGLLNSIDRTQFQQLFGLQ